MTIGEICNREVIISTRDDSVFEAAQLMRQYHVGDIIVVEQRGEDRVPVGILTDRDIVIELVAKGLDAAEISVADVMSFELVTVTENDQLPDLVQVMHEKGVRRAPVVNSDGVLVGIVTVDDLIELMAEQLNSLVGLVQRQQHRENLTRVM
jgi:CBS domain-containing protein